MRIVIEGIDGVGKATQIALLKKKFDFALFKYPTKKFTLLHDYLEKRVELEPKALFLLFLSDIADGQQRLASTQRALIDRYVFSTIAYGPDEIGYGGAKRIVKVTGFIRPDAVLLLDIPPALAKERKERQKRPDRYEIDVGFLERVRKKFLRLAKERFLCRHWHIIDAARPVEEIHDDMVAQIKKYL